MCRVLAVKAWIGGRSKIFAAIKMQVSSCDVWLDENQPGKSNHQIQNRRFSIVYKVDSVSELYLI